MPKPSVYERALTHVAPDYAMRHYKARAMMAIASGWTGASQSRRSLKQFNVYGYDPDSDIATDLETLRNRSRHLNRNNPIASGALKTKAMNVIGQGIQLQAQLDRDALNMTETQADLWEANTEREWQLFWGKKECHRAGILNGNAICNQVYRQYLENGDVFVTFPRLRRRWFPYSLQLQVIEADRCNNKDFAPNSATQMEGVEKDQTGKVLRYHFSNQHLTTLLGIDRGKIKWQTVEAIDKSTGLPNVVHLYHQDRPGQSRGIPDLAPVIEPLMQLGRYTEAELMAAVVSGFFTVFITSKTGEATLDLSNMEDETGSTTSDDDIKLGNGLVVGLNPGEEVHDSNPGRPNNSFDPFVQAVLRQVGVALGLPFEILIKHFTSSYSAAQAALLEAWRYFTAERSWFCENFLAVVYEVWMYEAVALGRISAPGFFADPIIRQAYLGARWTGPGRGMIREDVESRAAITSIEGGLTTLQEKTAEINGGNWERNHRQRVKEHNARVKDGLIEDKSKKGPEQ
jgi:lambda family phage portal protein